jgi:hypothetical protein
LTTPRFLSAILIMALAWAPATYSFAAPQYAQAVPTFNDGELDQMLAPIALYPDPLLAQILPASSFGDQISQAQYLLRGRVDENLIEIQNWDISVKATAHYPEVLKMMAENPEWTASLGQAFITQERAVAHSIQRLRISALNDNVLRNTPQQRVIVQNNIVQIVPAQANVIYVPRYDPYFIWGFPALFAVPVGRAGVITFGNGFLIGSWLNRSWDWHGRGPYYHGWRGGGWVAASRPHVNTTNRIYVNNRFYNINVNHGVQQKNTHEFRSRMDRNAAVIEKPGARPKPPSAEGKAPPAPGPKAKPAPEGKPVPTPAPETKAPPAPSAPPAMKKPTPPPEVKTPAKPEAPAPQAKPAPAPARKAPPAPEPQAKPTPPAEPKAAPPPEKSKGAPEKPKKEGPIY